MAEGTGEPLTATRAEIWAEQSNGLLCVIRDGMVRIWREIFVAFNEKDDQAGSILYRLPLWL